MTVVDHASLVAQLDVRAAAFTAFGMDVKDNRVLGQPGPDFPFWSLFPAGPDGQGVAQRSPTSALVFGHVNT